MSAAKKKRGVIPLTISTVGLQPFTHSLVQEALKLNTEGYSAALTEVFRAPRDVIERCAAALLALASLDDCAAALRRNKIPELRTLAGIMRKSGSSGGKAKKGTRNRGTPNLEQRFNGLVCKNPDLSAEEVRILKAPADFKKMPRSTFARHWKHARKRVKSSVSI